MTWREGQATAKISMNTVPVEVSSGPFSNLLTLFFLKMPSVEHLNRNRTEQAEHHVGTAI